MFNNLKDAVVDALIDLGGVAHRNDIYNKITEKQSYDFKNAKTPVDSISAVLQNHSLSSKYGKEIHFIVCMVFKRKKAYGVW